MSISSSSSVSFSLVQAEHIAPVVNHKKRKPEEATVELPTKARRLAKEFLNFGANRAERVMTALTGSPYDHSFLDSELSNRNAPYRVKYINKFHSDMNGDTVMHHAARLGYKNRIKSLSALKFPLLQKNNNGQTPLDVYREHNSEKIDNEDVIRLLDPNVKRASIFNELYTCKGTCPQRPPLMYSPTSAGVSVKNRIHPGRFVTENLKLYYVSKHGTCDIPDQSYRIRPRSSSGSDNFVMATLGFIASSRPHSEREQEDYRVKFVQMPVNHPDYEIFAEKDDEREVHSERQLYRYLSDDQVLDALLLDLETKHGITSGFKIYGIILDIHSDREMCGGCENHTYENSQDTEPERGSASHFLQHLENRCLNKGYIIPKIRAYPPDVLTPSRDYSLHFTARISCFRSYFRMPSPQDSTGITYPDFDGISNNKNEEYLPLDEQSRNIKRFRNSVILIRRLQKTENLKEEDLPADYQVQTLFQNTNPSRYFKPTQRRSMVPLTFNE